MKKTREKLYINLPVSYVKTGNRYYMSLVIESEIQNKVEHIELRRSGRRFIEYVSMTVSLFKGKVAKGASYVNLLLKNPSIVKYWK